MAVNWTKEQQQVITSRNRNLLVSAAAGSGKTAVLVERIIQMVTDQETAIDIDQLLVMTFTNAAAAEMKERIAVAIDRELQERPYDEHLQRQATLVQYAQITTIDSFCLFLIRNYFDQLDLDPTFRIADEGELKLLQADVMERVMEAYYEAGNERFEQFVDTYATGKADGGIDAYIYQTYHFAQSNPWPDLWIQQGLDELERVDAGQWNQTRWMQFLIADLRKQVGQLIRQMKVMMAVCEEEGGPYMYLPVLQNELEMFEQLLECHQYEELNHQLLQCSFGRLAAARDKQIDPDKKNLVTESRNRIKKTILKLKGHYCQETVELLISDMEGSQEMIRLLLEMTRDYMAAYQNAKKDKNIVDFNDLEHYALELLVHWEDGQEAYHDLADLLAIQYHEILVDEYQDSNLVQETLIKSLSRERFGTPNVFMVGDVKQSIYKFRLARPELFMEKYADYTSTESHHQKIELHQNFRSREPVLASINEVFYRIMTSDLGNIEYTKEAALHTGAVFAESGGRVAEKTELLLIPAKAGQIELLEEEEADYTSKELEAKVIAARIKEMTADQTGLLVWDQGLGDYRCAEYGDMVILLRSMSGWSEIFTQVLTSEGIPAYAETGSGYFNSIEIEIMLSLLAVIDNPMQDIPLAAVLRSPIVALTDQELAYLVSIFKQQTSQQGMTGLYGAFRYYLQQQNAKPLTEALDFLEAEETASLLVRLEQFDQMLMAFRRQSNYLPTHQVLYEVYEKTGYYDYAAAMPGGETRQANLDMLIQKAVEYEKTSYKGLFHFIRYIEKLKKYDTDFGEAMIAGEQEKAVRIMSIHKSKGLEFPVVFLAAMGKSFNKQDTRSKILIDPELGIGTDFYDLELRVKASTLKKEVIKRKMELDSLGEELRVLYVAMTRAKEKLIMTATDKNLDHKLEKWQTVPLLDGQVPSSILSTAGSYLDWLLMSMAVPLPQIELTIYPMEELFGREKDAQMQSELSKEELTGIETETPVNPAYQQFLQEQLAYEYPYQSDSHLFTKVSVSEIKKRSQVPDQQEWTWADFSRDPKPALSKEKAAFRGTAYHQILEYINFAAIDQFEQLQADVQLMLEEGRLDQESLDTIELRRLWNLVISPLGMRMQTAAKNHKLFREQQFVVGFPAAEMQLADSSELVLVQGMIDAFLEEEDGLVLIDYKTDWVLPGEAEQLKQRYEVQLTYYKKALEQITGKCVKEVLLYSLHLQEALVFASEAP